MKRQRPCLGFALLIFMIAMIGLGAFGLSKLLDDSVEQKHLAETNLNNRILLEAKKALLASSLEYLKSGQPQDMGLLPCPDINATGATGEGVSHGNCGAIGANSIGLYPFKTIGSGKMEDASSACLWYVVSGPNKTNNNAYPMLNWDTPGLLKLQDEKGNLKHGNQQPDDPVAFIIAPGPAINGQDRTPSASQPLCRGNYTLANYLEDGPFLNYASYFPETPYSIWTFLSASPSSFLQNRDYNDRVISISNAELWDKIKETGDLSIQSGSPSLIKTLTQNLADCLASYGNIDPFYRNLIFPGQLILLDASNNPEYKNDYLYKDTTGRLYGRFPQDITLSDTTNLNRITNDNKFVTDGAGSGYCESAISGFNSVFWQNWKDHFFVVIAQDFLPSSPTFYLNKCTSISNCLHITGSPKQIAAIVFFGGQRTNDQQRNILSLLNDNSLADRQTMWNEYMDGINRHLYNASTVTNSTFENNDFDYAVCIEKTPLGLSAAEC